MPMPALALVVAAVAAPRADALTWTYAGTTFSGYIVHDDATSDPRPGLLMVPNWMGVTPEAVEKAKSIAGGRYVILLADMYGKDLRPRDNGEASKAAGALYADRATMRGRARAALESLRTARAPVDPQKLGAIGFCFGGSAVLELARSGAELDGVVSFHGGLGTTQAATHFATPLLVLNGAADSYVSAADIAAFSAEATAAGADWQLVQLGGAVHCFTEVGADQDGCRHDARAARRAYAMMEDFFVEAFAD